MICLIFPFLHSGLEPIIRACELDSRLLKLPLELCMLLQTHVNRAPQRDVGTVPLLPLKAILLLEALEVALHLKHTFLGVLQPLGQLPNRLVVA